MSDSKATSLSDKLMNGLGCAIAVGFVLAGVVMLILAGNRWVSYHYLTSEPEVTTAIVTGTSVTHGEHDEVIAGYVYYQYNVEDTEFTGSTEFPSQTSSYQKGRPVRILYARHKPKISVIAGLEHTPSRPIGMTIFALAWLAMCWIVARRT